MFKYIPNSKENLEKEISLRKKINKIYNLDDLKELNAKKFALTKRVETFEQLKKVSAELNSLKSFVENTRLIGRLLPVEKIYEIEGDKFQSFLIEYQAKLQKIKENIMGFLKIKINFSEKDISEILTENVHLSICEIKLIQNISLWLYSSLAKISEILNILQKIMVHINDRSKNRFAKDNEIIQTTFKLLDSNTLLEDAIKKLTSPVNNGLQPFLENPEIKDGKQEFSINTTTSSPQTNNRQVSSRINGLPDEILLNIFGYLGSSELLSARATCKRWYRIADDSTLWKKLMDNFSSKHSQFTYEPSVKNYILLKQRDVDQKKNSVEEEKFLNDNFLPFILVGNMTMTSFIGGSTLSYFMANNFLLEHTCLHVGCGPCGASFCGNLSFLEWVAVIGGWPFFVGITAAAICLPTTFLASAMVGGNCCAHILMGREIDSEYQRLLIESPKTYDMSKEEENSEETQSSEQSSNNDWKYTLLSTPETYEMDKKDNSIELESFESSLYEKRQKGTKQLIAENSSFPFFPTKKESSELSEDKKNRLTPSVNSSINSLSPFKNNSGGGN